MKISELRKDATILQWLSEVNIREETTKSYLLGMQNYTEFTGKTPAALLEEADREQDENVKFRNRLVNKQLLGFRGHLIERNLAPLTIKNYINGAKAFYKGFDIVFKSVKQESVAVLKENKKIPNIEDIRDILKTCDPLETALVLVGCTSGLDSNTIGNLKVADFKNGYDPETGITTLILRRLKTDTDFVSFLTKEASEAVLDYLKYRGRTLETTVLKRQQQLDKQRVRDDSNYLFIKRKIKEEYLKDGDDEWRKIDRNAFMKIYQDISTKANKNTKKGQFNYVRSHTCRKFFDSTMINNGCDFLHIEEFMGHKLPGTQGHYFTPDVEELKNYYKNFVPYLTINKKLNVTESDEWQDMKEENERLRAVAASYILDGLNLITAQREQRKLRATMTSEEKREHLIEWVKTANPESEVEKKMFAEIKKALKISE